MNLGFVMCGSFCTFEKALKQMEKLSLIYNIIPIMSETAYSTDTRFGKAEDIRKRVEDISGNKILHTVVDTEPLGPKKMVDILLIAPCTGNTAAKIALGITDTSATMAVKSCLRINIPVVITLATNDALSASAQNFGKLLTRKNIYFTPLSQDDFINKPTSMVADFDKIEETLNAAKEGKQLQPLFI
ncbi:MAG: dipicolinate synthase subunit B [Ruminococcaceae bacterium]|nr:dipicolinate synthase subunit B [Oscillospiraceae bacterium]